MHASRCRRMAGRLWHPYRCACPLANCSYQYQGNPNVSRYTPLDQGARKGGHLHSELGLPHSPTYQAVRVPLPPLASPPSPPLPLTPAIRSASQHTSNTSATPPGGRLKPTCTLPCPSPLTPSHPLARTRTQYLSAYVQYVRDSAGSREAGVYVYNTHAVPAEAWAAELRGSRAKAQMQTAIRGAARW